MTKKERNEAVDELLYLTDAWETSCREKFFCEDDTSNQLALAAIRACADKVPFEVLEHSLSALDYAEAAALLLDGWNPGDPVEAR